MLAILVATAALAAGDTPRFTATASMTPQAPTSSDGRFEVHAALVVGEGNQRPDRFELDARLRASSRSKALVEAATACGAQADDLFKDSFEF